jgi:hypothetical protein
MKKQKIKNPNLKLFKLLNDNIFWVKFTNSCFSPKRIKTLREYRSKSIVPWNRILNNFVDDYKYITGDVRDNRDIIIELMSEWEI